LQKQKSAYLSEQLTEVKYGNIKLLWKKLNSALHRSRQLILPSEVPGTNAAERFNDYFIEKIDGVLLELQGRRLTLGFSGSINPSYNIISELKEFKPVTEKQVFRIMKTSPKSSNSTDPIPAWLLWKFVDVLLPTLTLIVNTALHCGMPSIYKQGIVLPLLKKQSLDKETLANYRPVTNLTFLSKTIERVVLEQTLAHLTVNDLIDPYQSGYKAHHSTETVLLHLQNEIISSLDNRKCLILVLLDMSSAFYTVKHDILLDKLSVAGMSGSALNWFSTYLTNRTQKVAINGIQSDSRVIQSGVPQGSVLGPLLFSFYVSGLGQLIRDCGVECHMYADDIQLFITDTPDNIASMIQRLENCIVKIQSWLTQNYLLLNDSKTEMIIFGTKTMLLKFPQISLRVGEIIIYPADNVRTLGLYLDRSLSMECHVNMICRASFATIRLISRIRRSLTTQSAELLARSLILSRIDYCATTLYGISSRLMTKLDRVINSSMRLVEMIAKGCSVKDSLKRHNWLAAKDRITLRCLLLIFKVFHGLAPKYIHCLIQPSQNSTLRSHSQSNLTVLRANTQFGGRGFAIYAPKLWNGLTAQIKTTKRIANFKTSVHKLITDSC
jgi:hypothetical protein